MVPGVDSHILIGFMVLCPNQDWEHHSKAAGGVGSVKGGMESGLQGIERDLKLDSF